MIASPRWSCFGWIVALAWAVLSLPAMAQSASAQDGAQERSRSAKIHTELGSMYFQDGNVAVALEELKIAIEVDPGYAPAYSVRALVNHFLREVPAAEDDFQMALRLNPDNPEINNNYGWFLCQVGREKDAPPYFLKAIRNPLYPTPDRAYTNAGVCAMKTGDLKSAEDYLLKASRLAAAANPFARYKLAEVYFLQGRFVEARPIVAELIRQTEPSAELLLLAVRVESGIGDRTAEANYTNQLRRKFPSSKEYQELVRGGRE